jgi:hypothetical protein
MFKTRWNAKMRKYWYSLKVYLNLTAFLEWFKQSGHRNPTVAASAATGKISVRTTVLEYGPFSELHENWGKTRWLLNFDT